MADDVMAVAERLSRLEVTVAEGFSEMGRRLDAVEGRLDRLDARVGGLEVRMESLEGRVEGLEGRVEALGHKLDLVAETLDDKMQTVLENVAALANEMRRTTVTIRHEHRADRRLMYAMLKDHGVRIRALEQRTSAS